MVLTRKFSEFDDGGDLSNDKVTVGLGDTGNTKYNNPWTFLPSGTTGDRPTPSASVNYRLRFNTETIYYEYYDPVAVAWVQIEDSQSVLPLLASHLVNEGASLIGLQDQGTIIGKTVQGLANATFIAQTDNGTLANGQFLNLLSTGIVKNTTGTGVLSVLTGSSLITSIINDDTFATAAITNIPTALSVKNYIASVIASSAGGTNGQIQYNNAGAFGGDSITTNGLGDWAGTLSLTGQLNVDNLRLDGNILSSTDSNGNIGFVPNGTGHTVFGSTVSNDVNSIIQANAVSKSCALNIATFDTANNGSILYLGAVNGLTLGVFTAVSSGRLLGQIAFQGADGSSLYPAAQIRAQCSGAVGLNQVPTDLTFLTADSSGVMTLGMTLSKAQILTLVNPLLVASGGSGRASSTAYALIAGGTTSTGIQQSLSTGTSGQFLQSGGSGALPSWTTATFPSTAGAAGTILRSNGTNFISSTATFADTYSASTLLYSNGANTVTGLATANNGVLITSAGGVPSISSTLPSAVQTNITALGTIDQNLKLTGVAAGNRYIVLPSTTETGTLVIQAGAGSAAAGGAIQLFGASHASQAGWSTIGISGQTGAKFAVNSQALGGGTNVMTVDRSGNMTLIGSLTITKVNGTEAANAVTASGGAGVITTSALTTAGGSSYAITWTNTFITTTSNISLTIQGGTNTTQNITMTVTAGAGTATLTIYNNTAATALNGTILIGYQVY